MKRLVLGLLLASLTLGIGLAAGAVPLAQDPNVFYTSTIAGDFLFLNIYNASDVPAAGLKLGAASAIVVVGDGYVSLWEKGYLFVVLPKAVPAKGYVDLVVAAADPGEVVSVTDVGFAAFPLTVWTSSAAGTSASLTVTNVGSGPANVVVIAMMGESALDLTAGPVAGTSVISNGNGRWIRIALAPALAPGMSVTYKVDPVNAGESARVYDVELAAI
jgi:hypothetical protein